GFGIGPRLNALGRLDDAAPIVEFLSSDDSVKINITAVRLEGLNERRKLLTDQIYQAALDQIDQEPSLLNYAALVLAHPDWHPGVIGIVASRLVERFYRPVILIQMPNDALARGSARSIKGIDINKAIASQKELLARFGGHPMAAGLALEQEHISDFRHGLSRTIKSTLDTKPIEPTLSIDAYLNLDELTLDFVDDLTRLAPFGAGNPALVFATRNLKLIKHIPIGANKAHRRLVVGDSTGQKQNILWWHSKDQLLPEGSFDLAYRLSINTFRGKRRLQLLWLDYRQETEPTAKAVPKPPAIKVIDHRQEINPLATLKDIQSKGEIQIWAEGIIEPSIETVNRDQITKHKQLVLWTIPPSARVLEKVIHTAAPETVYLFDSGSGFNRPESLLKRLASLVKYAISKNDGSVVLSKLAAATGERASTMHMGLFWLEAKGYIQIVNRENDTVILRHGGGRKAKNLDEINREFSSMFRETISYKAYFKRANPTNLIR
ncbi:MAG: DHHA1 domain-containing protein, partial [Chloroflexota bacterium]